MCLSTALYGVVLWTEDVLLGQERTTSDRRQDKTRPEQKTKQNKYPKRTAIKINININIKIEIEINKREEASAAKRGRAPIIETGQRGLHRE
jgi:hypothetical protein